MGKFHTSTKILVLPPPQNDGIYTFLELTPVIISEIQKYHSRWNLHAVCDMDFDDVKIIILNHVGNKFGQWNQKLSLFPWLHTLIRRQLLNLWRDKYWNFQQPCTRCAAYDPLTNHCNIYGSPCLDCPLYNNWIKSGKSQAYNIKFPKSIYDEGVLAQVEEIPDHSATYDLEAGVNKFHMRMKEFLNPVEYRIYQYLFIDGLSEFEVAEKMGYKKTNHSENNERAPGYRWIAMVVKEIKDKAKKALEKYGAE